MRITEHGVAKVSLVVIFLALIRAVIEVVRLSQYLKMSDNPYLVDLWWQLTPFSLGAILCAV